MSNPKLKFQLNQKLDKDLAWEFYHNPHCAGADFWCDRVVQYHDQLAFLDQQTNKHEFLNGYIDELYQNHKKEFEKRAKEIEKLYQTKADLYFKTVAEIFNNHPWPKGKYIAYLSVFAFGPRFLADKTLQVFMYDNDRMVLFTIFHEMLHFIFYDYAIQKYPDKFKNLNTNQGIFWDLAEIFNAILQDTPLFVEVQGKINNMGYPDHKKYIPILKKLWDKEQNIDQWITQAYNKLS